MLFIAGMVAGIVATLAVLLVALLWPDRSAPPVDLED